MQPDARGCETSATASKSKVSGFSCLQSVQLYMNTTYETKIEHASYSPRPSSAAAAPRPLRRAPTGAVKITANTATVKIIRARSLSPDESAASSATAPTAACTVALGSHASATNNRSFGFNETAHGVRRGCEAAPETTK